ncbi:OmpA family protein [Fibrella aquatilis]|uniref:OmpA family protein n=1 Tax=Fibrella aquatilis TaxID=2817059 RepID=A0A939G5P1_9BACT|nr:OmpA family protein [Fibrella aquatilis]MBO0932614.1 OmpA family protein [Fibrella aquatilis]
MFTNKTPWIVLLLLWMGGSTWWHVCKIKQLCGDDVPGTLPTAATAMPDASTPGLTIADGDKLNLSVPGNFVYGKSGEVANPAAVGNTLQTVADYLKGNPGRIMTITGHYHADEQNPSTFPNLGIARAEAIKADLMKLGVPAAQLATASMLVNTPEGAMMPYNAKGDSLYGGLAFSFTGKTAAAPAADTTTAAKPKTEEALAEAQKFTSVFKPIDLYFKSGQSSYIRTGDTKKFFAEAEKYLKANKDKKLLLTGHTDDQGPEGVNLELSKARASGVKSRLRKDGISADQIEVEAKGETQPKESNETADGRKANRRVTVVVQ